MKFYQWDHFLADFERMGYDNNVNCPDIYTTYIQALIFNEDLRETYLRPWFFGYMRDAQNDHIFFWNKVSGSMNIEARNIISSAIAEITEMIFVPDE